MRLPFLLIFLLAIHASTGLAQEKGTKSAKPKTITKSKEFCPLAPGNTWVYETVYYNDDGSKEKPKEEIAKIKGVFDLPEGRFYCVEESNWTFWTRNTPKGMEDADIEIDESTMQVSTAGKPTLIYKYPVQGGEKYVLESNDDEGPYTRIEVRGVGVEIQTPAGKFNCIEYAHVSIETGNEDLHTWFAPGIGPVKYMTVNDGKVISISVLKSYKFLETTEKSAKSSEPKTIKKSKEFYPLVLGNTWVYETISYKDDGSQDKPKEDISKIKGVYDLKGGRFFCVEEFGTAFWSRNTPKGLEDTDIEIDEATMQVKTARKPSLIFKYPVKAGEKYDIELNQGEDPFNRMEIRGVDVEVETPAGKFKCIEYSFVAIDTGKEDLRTWLAPGIGPVKHMTYVDGKLDSTSVLKSYKLLEATEKSTQ